MAPKVGIYVMATNGFLVQQNFCGISVTLALVEKTMITYVKPTLAYIYKLPTFFI